MDYKQPIYYRFNDDSFKLVDFIKKQRNQALNILDLGAGSGIIGIELSRFYRPEILHFVEVQVEFKNYLEQNIRTFLDKIKVEIFIKRFSEWSPNIQYDLIACNPPYYLESRARPSRDLRRQICRTFVIDGWDVLINKISLSLNSFGDAFLVITRDDFLLEIIKNRSVIEKLKLEVYPLGKILILRLNKNRY